MSITIELEPETEAWLNEQAKREGSEPAQIAGRLLSSRALSRPHTNGSSANGHAAVKNAGEDENEPTALEIALEKMRNRTPEDIAAARALIQPGRPLPPGKTLEDMVWGKWPGDETDEEINAALEELS